MARRKKDKDYMGFQESCVRVLTALKSSQFVSRLRQIFESYQQRALIDILDDRNTEWDDVHHRNNYYGLYYDLRDLFDAFGLNWHNDGKQLGYIFHAIEENRKISLTGLFYPPPEQWNVWRMAKKEFGGWGRPSEEEIRQADNEKLPCRYSKEGFSVPAIGYLLPEDTDEKTIRNWIGNCGDYLLNGGSEKAVNENHLSNLDELMADGFLDNETKPADMQPSDINFIKWIEFIIWVEGERRRREAKSGK
jgi:hypothetical protein